MHLTAWLVPLATAIIPSPAGEPHREASPTAPAGPLLDDYRRLAAQRELLARRHAALALADSAARHTQSPYLVVERGRGVVELIQAGTPLRTAPLLASTGWPSTRAAALLATGVLRADSTSLEITFGDGSGVHIGAAPDTAGNAAGRWRRWGDHLRSLVAPWRRQLYLAVPPADVGWLRTVSKVGTLVLILST